MNTRCPSDDELREYGEGRLDDDRAAAAADHVEGCARCGSVVREMEQLGHPLLRRLCPPPPEDAFLEEPQCRAAVERAARMKPGRAVAAATEKPPWDGLLPRTIGQYRLLQKLGDGGMGSVYLAVHVSLRRFVAVKMLSTDRARSPDSVARFHREIETLGRLDHPSIVRATDAGEHGGRHFLVMDYVDGCDISRLVRQVGPLSVADACEIFCRAAVGLQHVHENGLVHRDVKPSNLMLTRDGAVKLLDLGLARLTQDRRDGIEDLTDSDQLLGTLDYMAPEQVANARVDIRADLFALGATLFKLLTGESPLSGPYLDTHIKKVSALLDYEPRPITECRGDLPHDLVTVIERLLAADPADRPATPAAAAAALDDFARGSDLVRLAKLSVPPEPHETMDLDALCADSQRPRLEAAAKAGEPSPRGTSHRPKLVVLAAAAGGLLVSILIFTWAIRNSAPIGGAPADRAIAEEVLRIGGKVDLLLDDDTLQLSDFRELPDAPFIVQWIMLTGNPRVDDTLLARVAALRGLHGITLQHTRITDEGIRLLGRIPTLTHLFLFGAPLSDDGMRPITELTNLQELVLNDTQITNVTLHRLSHQRQLTLLYVKGTRITDDGLEHVGRMTSLQQLDLRETSLTDRGLAFLRGLTNLEELSLSQTAITDTGLAQLAALPRLKLLEAVETGVTSAGVAQIQVALPQCQVVLYE